MSEQLHILEPIFYPIDRPGKDIWFRFLDNTPCKKLFLFGGIFLESLKLNSGVNVIHPVLGSTLKPKHNLVSV